MDVVGVDGVGYAEGEGDDAGHGEAEHRPGHEEFVAFAAVELEAELVDDGAEEVEDEEDGGGCDVVFDGGLEADLGAWGKVDLGGA